jgi:hypothetical protein
LYGQLYNERTSIPEITAEIVRNSRSDGFSYIIIYDIQMIDNCIGNGSIAMKYFLNIVKKLNSEYDTQIKYIFGELSHVDKGHFDRLEHYYNKFGYKVTFNEERTRGKVRKDL